MDFVDYCLFRYWQEHGDPRTAHFPLMGGGPLPVLAIIACYVLFVKWLGPTLMKAREPLRLQKVLIVYNVYNVLVNVWFFCESIYCLEYGHKLYDFQFPSKEDRSWKSEHTCTMIYIYMLSKFVDMSDTIFFVLRKKDQTQASFLHIYHHSIVPFIMWMAVKLMPCAGPAGLFPLLNSLIHAIMYTYYTLTALGPQYRRLLFWKKYITIMQLIQFVCYIVHATLFLFLQNGYPKFIVYIAYVQNPFFFMMFYQFFHATYRNTQTTKTKQT